MTRMVFKNAYNYDSATRQVDTGDFDHILDETTDVGYAFAQVVDAAIEAGLEDFSENFIAENDLLTQAQADALYELVGAVLAHVAELDPHTQYVQASELSGLLGDYSTTLEADALYEAIGAAASAVAAHNAAVNPHPEYLTPAEGNAAYDALGAASAAVTAHNGASNQHPEYLTPAEGNAAYDAIGAAAAAVTTHEAAGNPHPVYLTQAEADALYDGTGAVGSHVAAGDPHTGYLKEKSSGGTAAEVPEHTHEGSSTGGTIAVFATRAVATITSASIANLATDTGSLTLAAGWRLMQLSLDRAARIRIYTTSAKRTADASRAIGTDPAMGTDHGLLFEFVSTAAITDYDLSPLVDGYCRSGTTVYWAIENRSGSTHTVVADLDWIRTE